eukprot:Amastigsp_a178675_227.p2 type:complete len:172 gc:universal Amastigsp_a178675_227:269-784(+)
MEPFVQHPRHADRVPALRAAHCGVLERSVPRRRVAEHAGLCTALHRPARLRRGRGHMRARVLLHCDDPVDAADGCLRAAHVPALQQRRRHHNVLVVREGRWVRCRGVRRGLERIAARVAARCRLGRPLPRAPLPDNRRTQLGVRRKLMRAFCALSLEPRQRSAPSALAGSE